MTKPVRSASDIVADEVVGSRQANVEPQLRVGRHYNGAPTASTPHHDMIVTHRTNDWKVVG